MVLHDFGRVDHDMDVGKLCPLLLIDRFERRHDLIEGFTHHHLLRRGGGSERDIERAVGEQGDALIPTQLRIETGGLSSMRGGILQVFAYGICRRTFAQLFRRLVQRPDLRVQLCQHSCEHLLLQTVLIVTGVQAAHQQKACLAIGHCLRLPEIVVQGGKIVQCVVQRTGRDERNDFIVGDIEIGFQRNTGLLRDLRQQITDRDAFRMYGDRLLQSYIQRQHVSDDLVSDDSSGWRYRGERCRIGLCRGRLGGNLR